MNPYRLPTPAYLQGMIALGILALGLFSIVPCPAGAQPARTPPGRLEASPSDVRDSDVREAERRQTAHSILEVMGAVLLRRCAAGPTQFKIELEAAGSARPFETATLHYSRGRLAAPTNPDAPGNPSTRKSPSPYAVRFEADGVQTGMSPDPVGLTLRLSRALVGRSLYVGRQQIDGSSAYVLHVEDIAPLAKELLDIRVGQGVGLIYVDEATFALRGVSIDIHPGPDAQNPDVQNPDVQNPDVQNPDVQNPDVQAGARPAFRVLTFFDRWEPVDGSHARRPRARAPLPDGSLPGGAGDGLLFPRVITSSMVGALSEEERIQAERLYEFLQDQEPSIAPGKKARASALAGNLAGMAMGTLSFRLTVRDIVL